MEIYEIPASYEEAGAIYGGGGAGGVKEQIEGRERGSEGHCRSLQTGRKAHVCRFAFMRV